MALAATDPSRYPNKPVSPAAVPAAFLGTKSVLADLLTFLFHKLRIQSQLGI
jgi:hypothetical protein